MTGSDGERGESPCYWPTSSPSSRTQRTSSRSFSPYSKKTIDDLFDATRRPVSGEGTNGAGGLGSPFGRSTAGALLTSHGSPGAALPRQPIGGGPGGAGTFEQAGGLGGGRGAGRGTDMVVPTAGSAPPASLLDRQAGSPPAW